jgi:Tfp pilus assembly protein PilO
MIPFRRAFDENRRLLIPVAAGLALNVILFAGVVYPLRASMLSAEQRQRTAAAQLLLAEREDQAASGLVQGKSKADAALQGFYRDVLPATLASARNITYLRLQQLADKHHLERPNLSFDPEPNPKGALRRVRVTMALQGSYDDIRRFIYELEKGTDFIVIDDVMLVQNNEPGGALQLTLNLSTFYKHES